MYGWREPFPFFPLAFFHFLLASPVFSPVSPSFSSPLPAFALLSSPPLLFFFARPLHFYSSLFIFTPVFDEIRRLFRESANAFRMEMNAREPEDQVAELLTAMRRELVAAKAALPEYEAHLQRTRAELERERSLLEQSDLVGPMAEKIGDAETARVAREFIARQAPKVAMLEQKLAAAEAELALRRTEVGEMTARYKEADANRFLLLSQMRLAFAQRRARAATGDAGVASSLSDLDRMEQKVAHGEEILKAQMEIDSELGGSAPPPPPPVSDVEERLREMKRRMGRE
jgi:phage shock protein A